MLITIIQRIIADLKGRGISLILEKYHTCIEIKLSQHKDISLLRFIIKKCR